MINYFKRSFNQLKFLLLFETLIRVFSFVYFIKNANLILNHEVDISDQKNITLWSLIIINSIGQWIIWKKLNLNKTDKSKLTYLTLSLSIIGLALWINQNPYKKEKA